MDCDFCDNLFANDTFVLSSLWQFLTFFEFYFIFNICFSIFLDINEIMYYVLYIELCIFYNLSHF